MTRKLYILLLAFFTCFCIAALLASIPSLVFPAGSREVLLTQSVIQNIVAFAGAAIITAILINPKHWGQQLGCSVAASPIKIFTLVVLFLFALPLLNQTIYWNANMHLPEAASTLENTLRTWEENSAAVTQKLLSDTSIGALIVNVLLIGVVTGICEELFFRGALQRLLSQTRLGNHGAIWIAAFIFSCMHFQFFGFVPRLLLGAFFGYLLYWSNSLWLSAIAHSLNNSMVVIFTWLAATGYVGSDFENFGVNPEGFPWFAFMSLVAFSFALIPARKLLINKKIDTTTISD